MVVTQVFDRPAPRGFYTVAGRFLFVETLDSRLARLIESLFAGWQLTPVASPGREAEIEIKFFCEEPGPGIPPGLNQFEVAEGGRCYTEANAYYLEFDNSLMRLRQDDASVRVDVWTRQVPETADAELARVTSFAVCAALRRFGLFDLHSAAVAEPDSGRGVLIVGPSGSGKSTLTYQLANAGWPYLSDDEVLLSVNDVDDGAIEARGFRSFFALRDTAGVASRNVFEPAGVFSSTRVSQVLPGWLLFTAISGEKQTRLRKVSQPETMKRLIRACPWATYDRAVAGANLDVLSRLTRQVTAFDLVAGTDLLDPGRAAELLTSCLRQN